MSHRFPDRAVKLETLDYVWKILVVKKILNMIFIRVSGNSANLRQY